MLQEKLYAQTYLKDDLVHVFNRIRVERKTVWTYFKYDLLHVFNIICVERETTYTDLPYLKMILCMHLIEYVMKKNKCMGP